MVKKNDTVTVTITDCTGDGTGVGRTEGMAVFVQGAAVGDTVDCLIIKAKSNYLIGKAVKLITPSADRCDPLCRAFPQCGGCAFRQINYSAELKLKEKRVQDAFERLGGIDVQLSPIKGAEQTERYRNKVQYPVALINGKARTGFYSARSHRFIPADDCLLEPEEFTGISRVFCDFIDKYGISVYSEQTGRGLVRHLYLRKAFATGEIMMCPVINGDSLPHAEELVSTVTERFKNIKTFAVNINKEMTNVVLGSKCKVLYGDGYITDTLCGLSFRLSPLSFYQVNSLQARVLYELAGEYAACTDKDTVLDLYCGTGTIGLTLAKNAGKLVGVEIVREAVEDAKLNASANSVKNTRFVCADASAAAQKLLADGSRPSVIVTDPPRKGCDTETLDAIGKMAPSRLVYVSCDPATLARDCKYLAEYGYKVKKATPVDLFPRTGHVEVVCLLEQVTPIKN